MNPSSSKGRVVVTCGPSYEPIDEVRRITNHSTGQLGFCLSNRLARAGWEVLCLKGVGALHADLERGVERLPFSTNDHLLERLTAIPQREEITAVFHAAALCDFKVGHSLDADGRPVESAKISSRAGEITLVLTPATKLIGHMRGLFPKAALIGWKYELNGDRADVVEKGIRQLTENHTDLCVLNGRAFGRGFGILEGQEVVAELRDKETLADWFAEWLVQRAVRLSA